MKKLGFGLMRLPLRDPADQKSIDADVFAEMADEFLARGFTYFDTAYPYHGGCSETAFREAVVKRHPREAFTVTDKMPVWLVKKPEDYQKYFDEQLNRCGVSYFDYYWLHAMDAERYDDAVRLGGFEFLRGLRDRGLVRHIGFSFHDKADVLEKILSRQPEVEYVQLQINYLDWESSTVQSRLCLETARKYGKKVIVMEPVKGGKLAKLPAPAAEVFGDTGASAASWALRFAASQPDVMVVLSGMSNMAQMKDNIGTMSDFRPLTAAETETAFRAASVMNSLTAVPCTGCRYCEAGCPKNIPIPDYMSLLNSEKLFGMSPSLRGEYGYASHERGRASDCVSCRQCEGACPQHIEITKFLPRVAELFEKK